MINYSIHPHTALTVLKNVLLGGRISLYDRPGYGTCAAGIKFPVAESAASISEDKEDVRVGLTHLPNLKDYQSNKNYTNLD